MNDSEEIRSVRGLIVGNCYYTGMTGKSKIAARGLCGSVRTCCLVPGNAATKYAVFPSFCGAHASACARIMGI